MCIKYWGLVCLFTFTLSSIFANELKVNGVYNGINLHIQNPHDGSNNYCISAIYLNNAPQKLVASTLITLDLSSFKIGDKVEVKIVHKNKCNPKVLNPNALLPRGDFHFGKLKIDANEVQWEGRGENENGQYYIEAFRNSTWTAEKILSAQGSKGVNTYGAKVNHLSGANLYRVKYVDNSSKSYFSDEMEFTSDKEKIYFYPKSVSSTIYFSKVVKYEILDSSHKSVLKGAGIEIDCSSLVSGNYHIVFDNKTETFYKKPN
ncbi:MAG: hypothetical protein EAZ08_02755 [Cytophagales bacterium]|nr:MAG: hypothetical protein EAZ08_02755 [Cytophagales bacterium]